MTEKIYLIEIGAYSDDDGEIILRYASGTGFDPVDDTIPIYEPRLSDPGNFSEDLYSQGTTLGRSTTGVGEFVLNNADGELDALIDYGFGRTIILRKGDADLLDNPEDFEIVFIGTALYVEPSENEIVVVCANRQDQIAELPIVEQRFSGDDTDPLHVNGTEDTIKDQTYPLFLGNGGGENFQATLVNGATQTFIISIDPINSITSVWMQGAALITGDQYMTLAALQAATTASGEFDYYLGSNSYPRGDVRRCAYFRIGSALDGDVTFAATQGANDAARTPAQLVAYILGFMGEAVSAASVTALDALASPASGVYVPPGERAVGEVIDAILGGINGWWIDPIDEDEEFILGRLIDPAGETPVAEIDEDKLLGDEKVEFLAGNDPGEGTPASEIKYQYRMNGTIQQASDVVGIVAADPDRVSFLKNEWRTTTVAASGGILTKFPLAKPFTVTGYIPDPTAAATQATYQASLRCVMRKQRSFTVDESIARGIKLGDVIALNYSRYSQTGTDKMVVIGKDYERDLERVTFRTWQ